MPYVITTWTEDVSAAAHAEGYTQEVASRRTVATLDEAREDVEQMAAEHVIGASEAQWQAWVDRCNALSESGGTVGPLPDGTVIEVELVEWSDLKRAIGMAGRGGSTDDPSVIARSDRIIDAYNAREGS